MIKTDLFDNYLFPQLVKESDLNGPNDWEKSDLKILFAFVGPPSAKTISATHWALYNIVKKSYPNVFVDIYFEPYAWGRSTYYKQYPPYVGSFSKRTWEDFDVIGLSCAIPPEDFIQNAHLMLKAKIPVFHHQRNNSHPFILCGGVAMTSSNIFDNVIDLGQMGFGERSLPKFVETCLKFNPHTQKEEIINELHGKYGFINPREFKYGWEVKDGHVESTWLNQDVGLYMPEVHIPPELIKTNDTQRKYTFPGEQVKVSLQSSFGCTASGACNFKVAKGTKLQAPLS